MYTGMPSERDGAHWHDLHFTYEAISAAPDAVFTCVETLVSAVNNPLLTMTESGGLRFSCRVPDYLHPDTQQEKLYIHKHTSTAENPHQRDVYLEIIGENGYTRWDARCEILLGNLLEPPIIPKEILFAPVNALRAALHEPVPFGEDRHEVTTPTPRSLGNASTESRKEARLSSAGSLISGKITVSTTGTCPAANRRTRMWYCGKMKGLCGSEPLHLTPGYRWKLNL